MRSVLIILAAFALGGCPSQHSGVFWFPISAAVPPTKTYSKASQRRVSRELKQCGDNCKETREYIKDYGVLRGQVRAARKR